jgi:rod shape-determining protein MreC
MTDNRVFLLRVVLVWMLLVLLAATQARTPDGTPVAWRWVRSSVEPLVVGSSRVGTVIADVMNGLSDTSRMLVDNQRMRLELEELRTRNLILREDLAALQDASDLLRTMEGFEAETLVGRCVFRDSARGRMEVEVTAASEVPRDTPVVGGDGLVGRVVQSRGARCWVELLTHPAAAIAVQTADGAVQALATGTGRSDVLTVLYVPRVADLLQGDHFVTSGADGIYPAGIPVATVVGIRESEAAFLEVQAEPHSNLATLRVVLLLPWVNSASGPGRMP